ncbi:MAG: tetratricopeptide repeat protein, partial [Planctomycetaceae bacterium]|nr:tetratricopeptide repeat protein [Planctomycetaceae bacterium]
MASSVLAIMVSFGCNSGQNAPETQSAEQLLAKARAAFSRGEWAETEKLAASTIEQNPDLSAAMILAGQAAAQQGDYVAAVDHWMKIEDTRPEDYKLSRCLAAEVSFHFLGASSQAEAMLQSVLELDPEFVPAHQALAMLLEVEGRRREMTPHLIAAIRGGEFSSRNLAVLGWESAATEDEDALVRCREHSPDDVWPLYGLARLRMRDQQFHLAKDLLSKVVEQHPLAFEAQARLGLVYLSEGREDDFRRWFHRLPQEAHSDPDILFTLANYAVRNGQHMAAARCAWETLRRSPDHEAATYQLAQSLTALDRTLEAEVFATRHILQTQFIEAAKELHTNSENPKAIDTAAKLSDQLGHGWETWGWYQLGIQLGIYEPTLNDRLNELRQSLEQGGIVRMQQIHNPANQIDLSDLPLPTVPQPTGTTPSSSATTNGIAQTVGFRDDADSAGLEFQYDNGKSPSQEGLQMVESPGGGVAVLDYDRDGWPDLFFPQGGQFEKPSERSQDQFFRNSGQGFRNLTSFAYVGSRDFRHGATAGDFNGDGLPDLYTTGPGINRLFENLGDGTFIDVTDYDGL